MSMNPESIGQSLAVPSERGQHLYVGVESTFASLCALLRSQAVAIAVWSLISPWSLEQLFVSLALLHANEK